VQFPIWLFWLLIIIIIIIGNNNNNNNNSCFEENAKNEGFIVRLQNRVGKW